MRWCQLCLLVSLHTHDGLLVLEPSNGTLAAAPLVARADTHRRLSVDLMEVAKLVAADGAAGDNFGRSVAIDGNTVVVGANGDDDDSSGPMDDDSSGSAYVFSGAGSEGLVAGSDSDPTPQPTTAALGSDGSDLAQTPQPTIAALGSDAATRTGPLLALLVAAGLAL